MDGGAKGAADGKYAERACGIYDDFDHFFLWTTSNRFLGWFIQTRPPNPTRKAKSTRTELCAKAQPAFIKASRAALPPTSEGHRTLCAAQPVSGFPQFFFSGAQKGNFAHFAHKIALLYGRVFARPAHVRAGKRFLSFSTGRGGHLFRCPPFLRLAVCTPIKRPPTCLSRARAGKRCGSQRRYARRRVSTRSKNGSTAKTFTEKGLIFTGAPLIIETEVGQSG